MKTTGYYLLLILIPVIAVAGTISNQLNLVKKQLGTDYDQRAELVHTRSVLKSQSENIDLAVSSCEKNKERVIQGLTDINAEIAETNRTGVIHNKNKCTFTLTNLDKCVAYDAETHRLEAKTVALRKKAKAIEAEKDALESMRQKISSDITTLNAATKKNDADYNDNEKEIGVLEKKLERMKQ